MKFHFLAPLLHPFLAQSLPRSLPPSRRPCLASFLPRLFPSSTLPPSTLPSSTDASCLCSIHASSLPPLTLSLPPSLPPSPCSLSHHHLAPALPPSLLLSLPPLVPSPTITLLPPLPPSLLLSLPPSILPRPFPVSHHRFLPPLAPSVPPTFYSPALLPCPSLPVCLLPCNSIYNVCVYSVGELHWLLFREGQPCVALRQWRGRAISRWLAVTLATHPPPRIRFLRIVKKIRRSKHATNTHKHGRGSYLSDGTHGDSRSPVEAEPLRSKDRGILTYNIDNID